MGGFKGKLIDRLNRARKLSTTAAKSNPKLAGTLGVMGVGGTMSHIKPSKKSTTPETPANTDMNVKGKMSTPKAAIGAGLLGLAGGLGARSIHRFYKKIKRKQNVRNVRNDDDFTWS